MPVMSLTVHGDGRHLVLLVKTNVDEPRRYEILRPGKRNLALESSARA